MQKTARSNNLYRSRKQDICHDLLSIYDVISPGLTKERGLTLLEFVSVRLFLAKHDLDSQDHLLIVSECYQMLQEAEKCLKHERKSTFEHFVLLATIKLIKESKELISLLSMVNK